MSGPTRTELPAEEAARRALNLLGPLHGLPTSQALAVLKRAGEYVQWATTVDAYSPVVSRERAALQARQDARDAAS